MSNIFFISDTHFGHAGIVNFTRDDGSKLRPWDTIEEHDEALIDNWNKTVTKYDTIYHLGDVAMTDEGLKCLDRCKGNKILVRGNHDKYKIAKYLKYFSDIRGMCMFHPNNTKFKAWLSHIPVHTSCLTFRGYNIHGHTHYRNIIQHEDQGLFVFEKPDPRYICVSVEQIDYKPIALDDIILRSGI